MLGAATLLSRADRVRPRSALVVIGAAYAITTALLALPWSIWWLLAIALSSGLIGALGSGVQWRLVREIVPNENYLLARSAFTVSIGLMQILGFGFGGLLVNLIGSRPTLVIAAGLYAWSAVSARLGLANRRRRPSDPASLRVTWRDNRWLLGSPERRAVYAAMWIPNGLVVGCEAVFIPYSPHWAGLLMSAAALGMLAGDVLVARVLRPAAHGWTAGVLRLLLAAPYLPFAFGLPLAVATIAVAVASVGYAAGLLLQQRLLAIIPDALSGHALGLHSSGMLSMQAIAAVIAGGLAEATSPATAMTVLATASVLVTLALTPQLRIGDRSLVASSR